MSKKQSANLLEFSCSDKCRLNAHGKIITSAISRPGLSDYQLACFISSVCKNFGQVFDHEGRTALHMAASCGRRSLCHWLIKAGKADINWKDRESGYTPLHRSILYGHLNTAVMFIEIGAQQQITDNEDLTATDLAIQDRLSYMFRSSESISRSMPKPCQAYVWGTNNNYTLGTGNQDQRLQPELVDFFRKHNIFIAQAAIGKFHSVFVSTVGRVWVCGHGQGGRLGVDSEETVLEPKSIKTGNEIVLRASVGVNHTILLMQSGAVWTCGSNFHHVLGHNPPPPFLLAPRPISTRLGGYILGVAASHYSSVIWNQKELWTFGLNGGQLGHNQQLGKTIITPKMVTGLNIKGEITDVSASIGATVVLVNHQDVYLLYNYQIRRIATKLQKIKAVSAFGGELNPELDPKLTHKGSKELKVMVLTSTGSVFLWLESNPQFIRCVHSLRRKLSFRDIALCPSNAILISLEGEAYIANIKPKAKRKTVATKSKEENMSFSEFVETLVYHPMSISKVPNTHRAVAIAADPKGQNFIVLQEHPNNLIQYYVNLAVSETKHMDGYECRQLTLECDEKELTYKCGHIEFSQQMALLLEEADEDDPLHVILYEKQLTYKYGLIEFSQQMALLLEEADEDDPLHDILIEGDHYSVPAHHFVLATVSAEFEQKPRSSSVMVVQLPGVHYDILKQVLCFAYKLDCQIVNVGPLDVLQTFQGDVIKAALDLAEKWKITKLVNHLKLLKYENGCIIQKDSAIHISLPIMTRKWSRTMLPALHDVSLVSSDGEAFRVHKCVLAARLEYFNHMFTGGWVEADTVEKLSIPIPQIILRVVLDFLYTEEASLLFASQDIDFISSVLVIADQLFVSNLKWICELALSMNLSLRNAACLLQIAITYNADLLKKNCMHFICLNIGAVLESRFLEILDNKCLEELSIYYRSKIPWFSKPKKCRKLRPYSTELSEEEMLQIASSYPVSWFSSTEDIANGEISSAKLNRSYPMSIQNKKKSRVRKTSETLRKRFESNSSTSDIDNSIDLISPEKSDFNKIVEHDINNKIPKEEWVMVDKSQKIVQERLKAITSADSILPLDESFEKLSLGSINFPQLSSPPLTHSIQDNKHFPQLSTTLTRPVSSPKSSGSEGKQRTPITKLSQKQRKKLAESGVKEDTRDQVPIQSPWAVVVSNDDCSLADIMKNTAKTGRDKVQGQMRFSDIMAEEREQRSNWTKMKSKPLHLTQIEDKAMDELLLFYNATNEFDERVSVERVVSSNVAKPIWITSRNQ